MTNDMRHLPQVVYELFGAPTHTVVEIVEVSQGAWPLHLSCIPLCRCTTFC